IAIGRVPYERTRTYSVESIVAIVVRRVADCRRVVYRNAAGSVVDGHIPAGNSSGPDKNAENVIRREATADDQSNDGGSRGIQPRHPIDAASLPYDNTGTPTAHGIDAPHDRSIAHHADSVPAHAAYSTIHDAHVRGRCHGGIHCLYTNAGTAGK